MSKERISKIQREILNLLLLNNTQHKDSTLEVGRLYSVRASDKSIYRSIQNLAKKGYIVDKGLTIVHNEVTWEEIRRYYEHPGKIVISINGGRQDYVLTKKALMLKKNQIKIQH